jgi:hypothetical protein
VVLKSTSLPIGVPPDAVTIQARAMSTVVERLTALAVRLRAAGFEVATSAVIDAACSPSSPPSTSSLSSAVEPRSSSPAMLAATTEIVGAGRCLTDVAERNRIGAKNHASLRGS